MVNDVQSFLLGALAMLFLLWIVARPKKKPPVDPGPTAKAAAIGDDIRTKYAGQAVPLPLLTRIAEPPVHLRVALVHMGDASRELYHGQHSWRAEQIRVSVMSARHFLNLAEAAIDNPPPAADSSTTA